MLYNKPLCIDDMDEEEIINELNRGIESLKYGSYSIEDIKEELANNFGIND